MEDFSLIKKIEKESWVWRSKRSKKDKKTVKKWIYKSRVGCNWAAKYEIRAIKKMKE